MVSFLEGRPQNIAACQSVVSEAKSAQKPLAPPGFLSISRKQFLHNLDLEINVGARAHAWVDSMRASSPTHIKSSTPSIADDGGSWNVTLIPSLSYLLLHLLIGLLRLELREHIDLILLDPLELIGVAVLLDVRARPLEIWT
ncbi:hypothetical protein V6N13_111395 [Hibiscus sabdariffa]|uniref:Uncharacterized protein n=1 Tax=Hibiscus sabdariffa TaxID=183260 RepID=A0ABR2TKN9_9ROSI